MLLRRVIEHVKAQNWTAIALDFFIVVLGVFIGIQVSNWNESLAFEKREQLLLRELRGEITQNMADARSKGEAFLVGADAARRVLNAISRGEGRITPYLLVDAIGSRREIDRDTALRRMERAGAVLSTVESAIFEIVEEAGTARFRSILPLVR